VGFTLRKEGKDVDLPIVSTPPIRITGVGGILNQGQLIFHVLDPPFDTSSRSEELGNKGTG
jgi:hypothetical protein